jgi:protein-S-isoprenylcysteine O-methyltransferase Ste14
MNKITNIVSFWLSLVIGFALLWSPFRLGQLVESPLLLTWLIVVLLFTFILLLLHSTLQWKLESNTQYSAKHEQLKLNLAVLLFLGVIIASVRSATTEFLLISDSIWVRVIGLIILFDALTLISWSQWIFAKRFSRNNNVAAKHELVTHGLYSVIRHPRELGLMIFVLSCSLTFNSILGLIVSFGFIYISLLRIKDEDYFLKQEFGQEWEEYAKNTSSLIPYIY